MLRKDECQQKKEQYYSSHGEADAETPVAQNESSVFCSSALRAHSKQSIQRHVAATLFQAFVIHRDDEIPGAASNFLKV